MIVCDFCGNEFEAEKKRRYCSKECRGNARANFYWAHPSGSVVVIPAPPKGWNHSTGYNIKLSDGSTLIIEYDRRGKSTARRDVR